MFKKIAIGTSVFCVGLVGFAACSAAVNPSHKASMSNGITTTVIGTGGIAPPNAPAVASVATPDPYSTNGTWLVPQDIAPGQYRVLLRSGERAGYYAICSDLNCSLPHGIIKNDYVTGPSVLEVPQGGAVAIKLDRVTLVRLP